MSTAPGSLKVVRLGLAGRIVEAEIERVAGAQRKHVVVDVVVVRERDRRSALNDRPLRDELLPASAGSPCAGPSPPARRCSRRRRTRPARRTAPRRGPGSLPSALRHWRLDGARLRVSRPRHPCPAPAWAATVAARTLSGADSARGGGADSLGAGPWPFSARFRLAICCRFTSIESLMAARSACTCASSCRTCFRSSSTSESPSCARAIGLSVSNDVAAATPTMYLPRDTLIVHHLSFVTMPFRLFERQPLSAPESTRPPATASRSRASTDRFAAPRGAAGWPTPPWRPTPTRRLG